MHFVTPFSAAVHSSCGLRTGCSQTCRKKLPSEIRTMFSTDALIDPQTFRNVRQIPPPDLVCRCFDFTQTLPILASSFSRIICRYHDKASGGGIHPQSLTYSNSRNGTYDSLPRNQHFRNMVKLYQLPRGTFSLETVNNILPSQQQRRIEVDA